MSISFTVDHSGLGRVADQLKRDLEEKVKVSLEIETPGKEDRRSDGIEDIRITLSGEIWGVVRRMPDGEYIVHEGEIDE